MPRGVPNKLDPDDLFSDEPPAPPAEGIELAEQLDALSAEAEAVKAPAPVPAPVPELVSEAVPELVPEAVPGVVPGVVPEVILIHVLGDGFTALGQIWFLGQELEFTRGSKAYQDTLDRYGRSWLDLDENEQIERYGQVMFRRGPWRGKPYTAAKGLGLRHPLADETGRSVAEPTEEQLNAAVEAERRRNRAAPTLPGR
jgi:hypothetical protein